MLGKGVDVYDPATGIARSNSTDGITCYNDESFFVRHVYFTGADRPYDNLKRVLKAESNERAWATQAIGIENKICFANLIHYPVGIEKVEGVGTGDELPYDEPNRLN